jgi:hypothetical protein
MTVEELIAKLGEYPGDYEVLIVEESNGSQRLSGEKLTFRLGDSQLEIVSDIEGT